MEVIGKTADSSAYRVALDLGGARVVAHVPDALLSAQYGQEAKVSHGQAYEWIATQAHDLAQAIETRAKGGTPRPPFDQITLDGSA
ncbi:hypothetical protein HKCCSP123_13565 [Rhodobacterales bacterium HKCCSP123]|nr:hypothetical protein [Rhodobacterales bacterium HKCCSP123]